MKLTLTRALMALVLLVSTTALSQTETAPSSGGALPTAPSSAASASGTANAPASIPLNLNAKVAAINIEQAVFACNEGQRDLQALGKKFDPKRTELNNRRSDIDTLKKQQTATGVTEEKKSELQRQIDQKQKQLERDAQDAQENFNNQRNEIAQRILPKLGPLIMKYAQENGLGMIVDISSPWPTGPVLYSAPLDITKPIVDQYNVQSGVPAPPQPAATTPSGSSRPAGTGTGTTRPATTPSTTTKPPATPPKQ
jgi:outer membrane protein